LACSYTKCNYVGYARYTGFKAFIFNIQSSDRQFLHLESGGFRMLGLAYGVVWDLGIVQSLVQFLLFGLSLKQN
jgi:hypothetical protein